MRIYIYVKNTALVFLPLFLWAFTATSIVRVWAAGALLMTAASTALAPDADGPSATETRSPEIC
ncbi:MAG: hypothetical protein EA420_12350 [Candidatus Competibacteraceae bacterium]|nr:MAG: hypothetical protein EA420_12350 [Candidatus Competibacteraceae bacterium]